MAWCLDPFLGDLVIYSQVERLDPGLADLAI